MYEQKNTVVIGLTLGNKTATYTAIPLELYEKLEILEVFSISDTCDLLYYIIILLKHEM